MHLGPDVPGGSDWSACMHDSSMKQQSKRAGSFRNERTEHCISIVCLSSSNQIESIETNPEIKYSGPIICCEPWLMVTALQRYVQPSLAQSALETWRATASQVPMSAVLSPKVSKEGISNTSMGMFLSNPLWYCNFCHAGGVRIQDQ
jgi:hypothetical protein